jgi:hypothetical protein
MQVHEAFKLGFLSRCVEEGMSPEQTHGLSKMAASLFEKQALINFPSPMGEVRNAVGTLGDMAPYLAAGLAIPPALGGLAAYFANQAADTEGSQGIENIKRQELQETYERMAGQLQRQKERQDYKAKRKSTGRVFL